MGWRVFDIFGALWGDFCYFLGLHIETCQICHVCGIWSMGAVSIDCNNNSQAHS